MVTKINYPNEYGKLRSVVLMRPDKKVFEGIMNPKRVMFVEKPNFKKLLYEYECLRTLFVKIGIEVHECEDYIFPNQLFARDLALVTSKFILLARPYYTCRQGEEYILHEFLLTIGVGVPIFFSMTSMEGADFFITKDSIICSVGNRTSIRILKQLEGIMEETNCTLTTETLQALPEGIPQHMLGRKHIVSRNKIIVRKNLITSNLNPKFSQVIELDETEEVVKGYSMNIVTVDENVIIMPSNCPETKRIFEENGITCHTSPMSEITKLGGGFACCVLPLKRESK